MTPILSLLLICGLVAGLTLLRWRDWRNLRNLSPASKRFAILVHLGVCLILALFVWLFTISVGTPLTDYFSVLALLLMEGLGAGLISSFGLFSRFVLHIPTSQDTKRTKGEEKGEVVRLEQTGKPIRVLSPGQKVIYIQKHGRWTGHDHNLDEEPNSRIS